MGGGCFSLEGWCPAMHPNGYRPDFNRTTLRTTYRGYLSILSQAIMYVKHNTIGIVFNRAHLSVRYNLLLNVRFYLEKRDSRRDQRPIHIISEGG